MLVLVEQLHLSQFSGVFSFFFFLNLHTSARSDMWCTLPTWWNHWSLFLKAFLHALQMLQPCLWFLSGQSGRIITHWCKSLLCCLFSCLNKATAQQRCLLFTSSVCKSFCSPQLSERHMLCVSVYSKLSELYLSKTDVTFTLVAEWLKQKRSKAE